MSKKVIDRTLNLAKNASSKSKGGRLLIDQYPTHYLPNVGRQVMADGGSIVDGNHRAQAAKMAGKNISAYVPVESDESKFAGGGWVDDFSHEVSNIRSHYAPPVVTDTTTPDDNKKFKKEKNIIKTNQLGKNRAEGGGVNDKSRNLSKFMEGSHVVDEGGNPLRLYHGTGDDFQEFKQGHINKKDKGWLGDGFYFTNSPPLASTYASMKRGNNPNVMPIHLSLKNPFYATPGHKEALRRELEENPFAAEDFRNQLVDAGHDGVIMDYGTADKAKEYVAFHPNQIKSATGNMGSYDSSHHDITKHKGGSLSETPSVKRALVLTFQNSARNRAKP